MERVDTEGVKLMFWKGWKPFSTYSQCENMSNVTTPVVTVGPVGPYHPSQLTCTGRKWIASKFFIFCGVWSLLPCSCCCAPCCACAGSVLPSFCPWCRGCGWLLPAIFVHHCRLHFFIFISMECPSWSVFALTRPSFSLMLASSASSSPLESCSCPSSSSWTSSLEPLHVVCRWSLSSSLIVAAAPFVFVVLSFFRCASLFLRLPAFFSFHAGVLPLGPPFLDLCLCRVVLFCIRVPRCRNVFFGWIGCLSVLANYSLPW